MSAKVKCWWFINELLIFLVSISFMGSILCLVSNSYEQQQRGLVLLGTTFIFVSLQVASSIHLLTIVSKEQPETEN